MTLNKQSLKEWLEYIESLHPEEIELGLDRIRTVFDRLGLDFSDTPVVTIAGTNGKGSTLAILESIYAAAGYRVGSYSSPHLLRYNERVRIDGQDAGDEILCQAFAAVEAARHDTQLTYFEFGTLATLWVFAQQSLDLVILEAGLGGRLDAVNIIESDVAVITAVGIDHRDWLGDTREQIGYEKAGILRSQRPAVCSDPMPPESVIKRAAELATPLYRLGHEFGHELSTGDWDWLGWGTQHRHLPLPGLQGVHQLNNAAAALAVVSLLDDAMPVPRQAIDRGLRSPRMPGRLQLIETQPRVLLDVAHNPQAIAVLGDYIRGLAANGKCRAVLGMLKDKDIVNSLKPVLELIDDWYLTDLSGSRGASAGEIVTALETLGNKVPVQCFTEPGEAFQAAKIEADANDLVVVFGSFMTVSAIMTQL